MGIKILHVRVFKDTRAHIVERFYRVVGYGPVKFGAPPEVMITAEHSKLHVALTEVRNAGVTWKPNERDRVYEAWQPYQGEE